MKHYIEELVKEFIYQWAKTFISVILWYFGSRLRRNSLAIVPMASFVFVNIPRKHLELLRFLEN